jgi:predicted permease
MGGLLEDLRFGLRLLTRAPAFAAVAILSLALGIGANTAIFTLADAIFFRPLPVAAPHELVHIATVDAAMEMSLGTVSRDNLADLRESSRHFEKMEASVPLRIALQMSEGDEPILVEAVTNGYFSMLGVEAGQGRLIDSRDGASARLRPSVVLADHVWRDRFDADASIVGREIRLSGVDFSVVGVAPPTFVGLNFPMAPQAWVHVGEVEQLEATMAMMFSRRGLTHHVTARLAEGSTLEEAQTELAALSAQLASAHPDANRGRSFEATLATMGRVEEGLRPIAERAAMILAAIVGLVLLIACANVANLLLAQGSARRREIAIRRAMGASPMRLVRQLITESFLLSLFGGALGIVLALWAVDFIWAMQPGEHWEAPPIPLGLDARVLSFTGLLCIATTLLFGSLPAWRGSRVSLSSALRAEARLAGDRGRSPRLRRVLVVGQVALSLVAMIGAGLFVRSLQEARNIDTGFDVDGTGVVEMVLPTELPYDERRSIYQGALSAVASVEGVQAVAIASDPPMRRSIMRTTLVQDEHGKLAETGPIIDVNGVTPSFFDTVGIELHRGHNFDEVSAADSEEGAYLAIVNEAAAKRLWPEQDAVGRQFRFIGYPANHRVVAVSENTKVFMLSEKDQPMIYVWLEQQERPRTTLLLRSAPEDLERVLPQAHRALVGLSDAVAVHEEAPLREVVEASLWGDRMGAGLLSAFAFLALGLAAVGVYGLSSFLVNRRLREIGIRMALGAEPSSLRNMLLKEAMAPVLAGAALGLLLALALSPVLEDFLYEVELGDPLTYLASAALLVLAALPAAWFPASWAIRADPSEVLRRR